MFLFINRKEELEFLEERHNKHSFEFIVIYGRRRIGKTELIKNFVQDKTHMYFLCNKAGTNANVSKFKKQVARFFSEPEIATDNLGEIFSYIAPKAKEKIVIVFDEFPYLVEKDDAIPSLFQEVIDEVLRDKNIMLIICGSSISMMEELLGYKNPLYGRKTGHMKIDFLTFNNFNGFFPNNTIEENIKIYSILGGVPFYLEKFDSEKSALENAEEQILSKKGTLYEEVEFLLKEELREPDVYKNILSAISSGSTKVAEIADKSGIKASDMDRYLKALIRLGIVKKDIPVTETKSKKSLYTIDDNFFDFYSLFFEPNRSDIEIGDNRSIKNCLDKNFNAYVGKKFEKLVRTEMLRSMCPFKATKTGKWWGFYRDKGKRKELEIDAVALNETTKEMFFVECKWKALSFNNSLNILNELKEKSPYVDWNNNIRKEYFGIAAKKIEGKNELREMGFVVFDLDDFLAL
ncbi:MAG: ATP-binding protein [Methanosarcinaceae archaeon]|nr:ATP-binding protein [Methanosarcinaceae archaeon]